MSDPVQTSAEPTWSGYEDDENPDARDGWRVSDLSEADWCLSRIADLEKEMAENKRLEEQAILRAKARAGTLNERAVRGIEFFTSRLREFAETHRELLLKGGKRRSRPLLFGSIGWKKSGGGLTVVDPEALLKWAREQPVELEFLRIKEEPALLAIKEHFKSTGEVPPGMDVKPETEEFVAKAVEAPNGKH